MYIRSGAPGGRTYHPFDLFFVRVNLWHSALEPKIHARKY